MIAKILSLVGIAVSTVTLFFGVVNDKASVLVPCSIIASGCIIALAIVEGLSSRKDHQ